MDERSVIDELPKLLKDVRCFVDVGASLGQYTYFANRCLKDADIYSIEPDPFKFARLEELVDGWVHGSKNQTHLHNLAIPDSSGRAKLLAPEAQTSSGALFSLKEIAEWENAIQREVQCTTLDELFSPAQVDLVKVDVEGAELRVLRGARSLLQSGQVRFLVEVAPWGDVERGYQPSDVFRYMTSLGYDFSLVGSLWLFSRARDKLFARAKGLIVGLILDNARVKKSVKDIMKLFPTAVGSREGRI
jgi:FkbM family methyltransferase